MPSTIWSPIRLDWRRCLPHHSLHPRDQLCPAQPQEQGKNADFLWRIWIITNMNSLTKTLYVMTQDSPECAAAACLRGSNGPTLPYWSHGNMVLGFHQITDSVDRPDLHKACTQSYTRRPGHVYDMYRRLMDVADAEPRYNERYRIYQFFAKNPEGRNLEFQAFLAHGWQTAVLPD